MSRAASIYEDCAFPAQGRQPELGGRKNDEGRNTQVGAPGKQGLLFKGFRTMIIESPLQLIFRDLFYRLPAFAGRHDVFLKLEGFNITGSIKVKTAIGLVEDLEQRGKARPNDTPRARIPSAEQSNGARSARSRKRILPGNGQKRWTASCVHSAFPTRDWLR